MTVLSDTGASLRRRIRRLSLGRERVAVLGLTLATFAFYGGYSVLRQRALRTSGYDLGIFDQAVRQYSHFRAPIVALKGPGYNIFGDHFHPIIAVIAPLYWIWDTPMVLLVVQAALIAASVPIVYRFTRRRTSAGAALIVCAAYVLSWSVQGFVDFDFHEIAFAVPLLAGAIDALDREDDRTLAVCCMLLLLTREDMGAIVAVLGLLRMTRAPRRFGALLIAIGAVVAAVATAVIIPAFAPGGHFAYWTFDALGRNLPDTVGTIIAHPWRAIRLLFSPEPKAQTLAYLFVPVALLPLRSRYALIALPLLAERFWNSRDNLWTTQYHYNLLPWLVLVLAMVDGAGRLTVWSRPRLKVALLAWVALVPLLMIQWHGPTIPVIKRMADGQMWHFDAHQHSKQAALRLIPRNVCVAVDDRVAPQLTNRDRVTIPGIGGPQPDFVILDLTHPVMYRGTDSKVVLSQLTARRYRTLYDNELIVVLRSPDYRGPSARCTPTSN
ncbi:MAG: DUF2079 domain-containing protein [Jatrophihabitans sp.]